MDISEEILISRNEQDPDEPDDKVELPDPQIINMSPTSTDVINNNTPTIKASLIAAEGATIDDTSIVFKIDDRDITNEIKINNVSVTEHTVIYLPQSPISSGLHKISIYFKDSNGGEIEKEWTFTIGDENSDFDSESFIIFGLEIPKRTLYIILGGLALIALAIIVPLLLPTIWKDSTKEVSKSTILPESILITNEIPVIPLTSPVTKLTRENFVAPEPQPPQAEEDNVVFEAVQPEVISEVVNVKETTNIDEEIPVVDTSSLTTVEGITPMYKDSQPEPDLENLYDQIKELEEKEDNQQKDTTS